MDRKSRHKIAKSEKLVSAALQKRDENVKALLRRWPTYARRHATAVAAIVLMGQPRIDEPLSRAWARALRQHGIANDGQNQAAVKLYPIIKGDRKESSRFTEIFRSAPVWLDASLLKFELPNISKKLRWGSAGFRDSRRWPLLPVGTISAGDPIPASDPRWLLIMLFGMITVPFPNFEVLFREYEKNRSPPGARDESNELLEFLAKSAMEPDSEWSDWEKRRVRKLCDRIIRLRA